MAAGPDTDDRPRAVMAGLVDSLMAGVVRHGPSAPGPAGGRFLGREVSLAKALQRWGVPEGEAQRLLAEARAAGRMEVRFTPPPGGQMREGCTLIARRMPGNHAEVWTLPPAAEAGESAT